MILARAALRGADVAAITARHRIPSDALAAEDGRVPAKLLARMWEEVPLDVGDDAFGLHLGEEAAHEHLALLTRLFDASATVGDAVHKLLDLQRLVNDVHPAVMLSRGDRTLLRMCTEGSPLRAPRHATEFGFAWLVVIARRATGADLSPLHVRFEHARPEDTREHRRVFRCPIDFASPASELEFSTAVLDLPHKSADPALSRILESYAHELAKRLPTSPTFAVRVKEVLVPRLAESPTIDDVAHALKLSARTVQRYLAREETTFADVLDDVRRSLAEAALADRSTSIAQVSHALGYSDQSAFHKAFVRWTGKTPGAFRKGTSG